MPSLIRPEGPEPDDFRFSRRALATGVVGGGWDKRDETNG